MTNKTDLTQIPGIGKKMAQHMSTPIIYVLLIWNLIVFLLYGADKSKAKKGKRRISEKTLLVTAFLMGGADIIMSQQEAGQ
jgi:uncharacterized membrane protein YsdA (DUF1294 family)